MNIYKFELGMYRRSIVVWSLSMIALILMFMSFYQTFAADTQMMEQLMANYPEELLKAFGMGNAMSLSSVLGFFTFIFAFVQLCVAIQASNYGFHFLSVEERELTADFLMSKPVSRTRIILSKFLAAFTALTITNLIIWASAFGSIMLFSGGNEYEAKNLILLLISTTFFQLFFLSVGTVISVSVKKVRSVLSYSMALAFGLYVLNALRAVVGGKTLGVLSPFYHFDPGYILANGEYDTPMVIIDLAVIAVAFAASYYLYLRRNIHSA
jgi:ABC-2 type transport system permease protein